MPFSSAISLAIFSIILVLYALTVLPLTFLVVVPYLGGNLLIKASTISSSKIGSAVRYSPGLTPLAR